MFMLGGCAGLTLGFEGLVGAADVNDEAMPQKGTTQENGIFHLRAVGKGEFGGKIRAKKVDGQGNQVAIFGHSVAGFHQGFPELDETMLRVAILPLEGHHQDGYFTGVVHVNVIAVHRGPIRAGIDAALNAPPRDTWQVDRFYSPNDALSHESDVSHGPYR